MIAASLVLNPGAMTAADPQRGGQNRKPGQHQGGTPANVTPAPQAPRTLWMKVRLDSVSTSQNTISVVGSNGRPQTFKMTGHSKYNLPSKNLNYIAQNMVGDDIWMDFETKSSGKEVLQIWDLANWNNYLSQFSIRQFGKVNYITADRIDVGSFIYKISVGARFNKTGTETTNWKVFSRGDMVFATGFVGGGIAYGWRIATDKTDATQKPTN